MNLSGKTFVLHLLYDIRFPTEFSRIASMPIGSISAFIISPPRISIHQGL